LTADELLEASKSDNKSVLAGVHGMYTNILMKKLLDNPNNNEIRKVLTNRKVNISHISKGNSPNSRKFINKTELEPKRRSNVF